MTSREAAAQWQIACGSFKGVTMGKDYDNNIKNFIMVSPNDFRLEFQNQKKTILQGLITVAHMTYEDAMKCIKDAVPQAFQPRG